MKVPEVHGATKDWLECERNMSSRYLYMALMRIPQVCCIVTLRSIAHMNTFFRMHSAVDRCQSTVKYGRIPFLPIKTLTVTSVVFSR